MWLATAARPPMRPLSPGLRCPVRYGECFGDARRRLLKPEGTLLPSKLRIDFTAVEDAAFPRQADAIRSNVEALDVSHLQRLLLNDLREPMPGAE